MNSIIEEITLNQIIEPPKTQSNEITEVKERVQKEETFKLPEVREISLSDFDFRAQGFMANEVWTNTINLHARITKVTKTKITCECVIDKENRLFESRIFPVLLFDHLQKKEINHPVVICIKNKPGSTRIDIRDGKNIVDPSIFDVSDGWEKLINSGLDRPLTL
jgi:hypothetical protein